MSSGVCMKKHLGAPWIQPGFAHTCEMDVHGRGHTFNTLFENLKTHMKSAGARGVLKKPPIHSPREGLDQKILRAIGTVVLAANFRRYFKCRHNAVTDLKRLMQWGF